MPKNDNAGKLFTFHQKQRKSAFGHRIQRRLERIVHGVWVTGMMELEGKKGGSDGARYAGIQTTPTAFLERIGPQVVEGK